MGSLLRESPLKYLTPLAAREDRAGGVPRHVVALSVPVQVVPEDGRALPGPEPDAQVREDGGPAQVHVRLVEQPGGDPVARA